MGHAVEPLVDGAGKLAVAADADLGEGLQPHLHFGQVLLLRARLAPPSGKMHECHNDQRDQRQRHEAAKGKKHEQGIERDAAQPQRFECHVAKIADSRPRQTKRRT